jgi:hypothetical protein
LVTVLLAVHQLTTVLTTGLARVVVLALQAALAVAQQFQLTAWLVALVVVIQ